MEEIWKTYKVVQFKHTKRIYEISSLGRLKINGELVIFDYSSPLYFRKGKQYIHRMVAETFIPNPDNKPCIDHIDTDIHNNSVYNLRWVTYTENNNNPITKQRMSESTIGFHHSEETKQKIRLSSKGRKMSEDAVRNASEKRKGFHHSEETKKIISEKLKLCAWNKGKKGLQHHSEETKQKLSDLYKGKKLTQSQIDSISKRTKDTIWINDGVHRKRIFKEQLHEYTNWNLGWKIS